MRSVVAPGAGGAKVIIGQSKPTSGTAAAMAADAAAIIAAGAEVANQGKRWENTTDGLIYDFRITGGAWNYYIESNADSNGAIPVSGSFSVAAGSLAATIILNAATATGAGSSTLLSGSTHTFQAVLSNTTTPTATVSIEVSNDNTSWSNLGTIILSGASDTGTVSKIVSWLYVRANVTAISGTSASVTVTMGA